MLERVPTLSQHNDYHKINPHGDMKTVRVGQTSVNPVDRESMCNQYSRHATVLHLFF